MRASANIFAMLATASLLVACDEPKPASKPPRPIRSLVVHGQNSGETITQTGEIRPRYETPLSFRIAGELRSRRDTGGAISAGDVVAMIDSVPARNDVLSATAEVEVAQAALALAEQSAQRAQDLFTRAVATRVQVQDAEANLRTARARLDVARSNLAKANETLTYTELKAPHAGVIAGTSANAGQTVAAGQSILTLVSADKREAVFDVPERLISGSDLGDPSIEVSLVSDPSVKASGKVREVAPTSDASTRTYRVKIAMERGAEAMPFGAAVVGRIVMPAGRLYPVPASALTRAKHGPAVFVYDAAVKELRLRSVTVARYEGEQILVAQGLADGDVVATAGVSKLRDGEAVTLDQDAPR